MCEDNAGGMVHNWSIIRQFERHGLPRFGLDILGLHDLRRLVRGALLVGEHIAGWQGPDKREVA